MKKIKISESQVYMVQDVMREVESMNSNPMVQLYNECKKELMGYINLLDRIFNKLTFDALGTILEETPIEFLEAKKEEAEGIYSKSLNATDKFDDQYDSYSDKQVVELSQELNTLGSRTRAKTDAIENIVSHLIGIKKHMSAFNDIKKIDAGERNTQKSLGN